MSNTPRQALWLLLPAAGIGRRMGADIPKQYLTIHGGHCILDITISRLLETGYFAKAVVVLHQQDKWFDKTDGARDDRVRTCLGGEERSDSVLCGLETLLGSAPGHDSARPDDWVLVHDAVRPCVAIPDVAALIREVISSDEVGGLLATPVTDTLKRESQRGLGQGEEVRVEETVSREGLWRAMTPQMFRIGLLKQCLEEVKRMRIAITDEASAFEEAGYSPLLVKGRPDNVKITVPEDLPLAGWILGGLDGSSSSNC